MKDAVYARFLFESVCSFHQQVAAMLSKRTRHPRWGMVAARSVAKARTLTKGQPDTVKLKKEIPCRDRNQNGTSLCYDDIGFEQDSIEL